MYSFLRNSFVFLWILSSPTFVHAQNGTPSDNEQRTPVKTRDGSPKKADSKPPATGSIAISSGYGIGFEGKSLIPLGLHFILRNSAFNENARGRWYLNFANYIFFNEPGLIVTALHPGYSFGSKNQFSPAFVIGMSSTRQEINGQQDLHIDFGLAIGCSVTYDIPLSELFSFAPHLSFIYTTHQATPLLFTSLLELRYNFTIKSWK